MLMERVGGYYGSFAERPALFEFTYGSCGDCSGADACVRACVYVCV